MLKEERQVLLVVSDEEVRKNIAKSIWGKFKFEVEIAKDGKNALTMMEQFPWQYDVVVIYVKPEEKRESLELLKDIKTNYISTEIIYIIDSDKRDTAEAWREGAFNCFIAPINYDGIAYAVKFAREQAQFRRERKMLNKLQELSVAISSATELKEIQNLSCKAAVEILSADHSGLVLFEKDLAKGKVIAEYPEEKFIDEIVQVKGILLEEALVYSKKIINIPDLSTFKNFGSDLRNLNICSILIVPIVLNGKVIASISLDMKKNRFFYSDEIELCRKLADQVAVAIGKARYLKELSVLNKIARDIGSTDPASLDIKEMLGRVKTHATKLLDVTNFYIALYDEEKKEYSFPYYHDEVEEIDSVSKEDMRNGLTEYVRNLGHPILIDKKMNQKLIEEGKIKLVGEPTLIWLGAPLIARRKVLGVMVIQNYYNEKAYDEHDLKVLETIASQTAIAIDNARLFNNAQRRIDDLEIVNNIVQTISTKLNTDDLFQTMVVQIAGKLNCSHCTIFLPRKEKEEIRLIPQISHGKFFEQIMNRSFGPGEGLAGWVFQNGESIISTDARLDSRYAQARRRIDKPRSMLVVPVKVGKRTIGVISADQDEKNWFNDSDRQLVETLAQHAVITFERALGLNLLQEVGLQLISSEEEEKILQRIVAGAIELTNTEAGIIYLISADGKSITKRLPFPPNFDPPLPRMNNENGFTRQVIVEGRMIIVPDMTKEDRVNPWLREQGFNSMIILPLKMGKKVFGVLYLNSKETNPFSETECSLLGTLSSQAAIAIYNSGLFQEAQNQRTQIETLYEAFQEIAAETMNVKSIFDKILEKTVQLFNADSAQILLLDEAKNEIKIVFSHELEKVFKGTTLKGIIMKKGEGISWDVFETKTPINTGDYHNETKRAKIFDGPTYNALYNSLAVVPLKWKGNVICAIALTSVMYHKFTENDIQLLEKFSSPAAIAIAIAREISFRQTLLDNSPDAIVAIDNKGVVKEFNKASEKIFKCTKDEILNRPFVDLWGELGEAERILDSLQNKIQIDNFETFFTNQFDEQIPVLFSGSILFAEDFGDEKEKIGIIGQIEDQRMVSLRGRTRKLFEVLEEINSNEELTQIFETVLYKSINLLEADSGYLVLKQNNIYSIVEICNNHQKEAKRIGITIDEEVITIINGGIPKTITLLSESAIAISHEGRSGLVLPLKIENKIIGGLYLESNATDFFREENDLLQIFSRRAAVAINRAQLKEESEQLQKLKEIGDKIRVEGEFKKYKDMIVKTSRLLLRAEISSIFIYDKSKRCLSRVAMHPKIDELEGLEESYPSENGFRGITGQVLEFKESMNDHIIYLNEDEISEKALPMHLEKYKRLPSWKKIRHEFARSPIIHYLVVPIFGEKGKVFGALRVMNKISKEYTEDKPVLDEHGFRNPEDVKLLKTIASFLSQALSSERKAEKLRLLHEITDEISSKTDIQGIGDCLVQSIVKGFGYSACSIRFVRGDYFELISEFGFNTDINKKIILHKSQGLVGRAFNEKKIVSAYDILSDDEKINGGFFNKNFAKEENIRSACCIPIKDQEDEIMGVIIVYMRKAPYHFQDYELNDNFYPISATCSIAWRKVQAKEHLQKLLDILELVHVATSKEDIFDDCIKEMLPIFDAHAAIIYETKKITSIKQASNIIKNSESNFHAIFFKNLENKLNLPMGLIKQGEHRILNAVEFPEDWNSIRKEFDQALLFTLDFQDEILGAVVLFSKKNTPLSLPESDRKKLALAISRQLAIAFKNIEISKEIEKRRLAEPAIISAQYVSGMIHELASIAQKGKGATTYIRGCDEFRNINNRNCKVEMSKIESSFDEIGVFTGKALRIKDMGEMNFEKTLEYGSINKVVFDVLNDSTSEIRKKIAEIKDIKDSFDKKLNQHHAFFDEILIKQAIRNLIYNSLRWIPEKGYIKISTTQKDDYIFITVEDNGQGVAADNKELIFDPYFSTAPDGHGIGLFFVKSVANMHRGDAKIVSLKNPTIFEMKISSRLRNGG